MAFGDGIMSSTSIEMKTTATVFVLTLVAVKLLTMVNNKKKYKLPPGPRGIPLLGYLPFFGQEPPVTFNNMRKTYGDVISISMGSWPAVVIQGREAIKEALVTKGDDFSARPSFTTAQLLNEGRNFAFSLFGPLWKAHRKIVVNALHNFSNSRNNPIEEMVCREAETVVQEFLAHGAQNFCPLVNMEVAGASMIYQLCYGSDQSIRDQPEFMSTLDGSRQFQKFTGAGNPVDAMPWLRYVMPSKVTKFIELLDNGISRRKKKVEEHEATFDSNNLRDIADGLIHAGNTLTPEEKAVGLDKRRVVESLDTIFGAGGQTVANTLQWFVALMAKYPNVQERLFAEVDSVVGQGRHVALADRSNMPLVDASLYEVLRVSAGVPFSIPHATTCDTTLQGYDIPAGTVVMVNLYSIGMDVELWGDPENFRPERFLSSDGQLDRSLVEHVTAFSLGRRRCPGEFLAKTELFLFVSTLLQRLKFFKPPGQPDLTLKARFGLGHDLLPFEICVCARE